MRGCGCAVDIFDCDQKWLCYISVISLWFMYYPLLSIQNLVSQTEEIVELDMWELCSVEDPRAPSVCPPTDQDFLNCMQFLGKSGKFVCWRPPRRVDAPLPTGNTRSAPDVDSCNNAKLSFFTYNVKLFSGIFHLTFIARIRSKSLIVVQASFIENTATHWRNWNHWNPPSNSQLLTRLTFQTMKLTRQITHVFLFIIN